MDNPLQKALDSLQQSIAKRTKKAVKGSSIEEKEENLFKANALDPSPRDQQDLMAFPFFSLEKSKRTKPIIYEQGNVRIFIEGRPSVGIATIWDADFLIWAASQLNAAIERGETPVKRLWIVPYQFLIKTRRMNPQTMGNRARLRFVDCLRRLQGTTVETTIMAGGKQITEFWS